MPVVHAELRLARATERLSKLRRRNEVTPFFERLCPAMTKEERKKASKKRGSGTPTDAYPFLRILRMRQRALRSTLACRRSTAALPGDVGTSPSSFRPGFLGRGRYDYFAKWALPTPTCPSPVASTAGHSAGGMMPKAARGKFARPPAGTAVAPSDRIRNTSRNERDSERSVTEIVTHVNKAILYLTIDLSQGDRCHGQLDPFPRSPSK
jgi:hypothetical protein